ncbi:MAG: polysaccharide deacetylase family protein [Wenzhouxiangellaceae bacterium]|nr:polysaccharide deacetylase family protein [Wenzhouxiangellaceae bacterium]
MTDRFVVLAWHSIHVVENQPAGNDLMAFSEALEVLDREHWTVLPLASALAGLAAGTLPARVAVLTLDDGSVMDFEPFDHPTCGPQHSIYQRLQRFRAELPAETRHRLHASSFVIASPDAREELDRTDYMGLDVWRDDWWRAANASGLMSIESHSWDHNHASLSHSAQRDNRRGDFFGIETEAECRVEIDRASDYIARCSGCRPRYFAYPYGQASDYLRCDYLPRRGPELGLEAALGCDPEPVTADADRWFLPRYMCQRDWNSAEGLSKLLADATGCG